MLGVQKGMGRLGGKDQMMLEPPIKIVESTQRPIFDVEAPVAQWNCEVCGKAHKTQKLLENHAKRCKPMPLYPGPRETSLEGYDQPVYDHTPPPLPPDPPRLESEVFVPKSPPEATLPGEIIPEEDLETDKGYAQLEKDLDMQLRLARKDLLLARYQRMTRELNEKPLERQGDLDVNRLITQIVGALSDVQKSTAESFTASSEADAEVAIAGTAAAKDPVSQLIAWATQNPAAIMDMIGKFAPNLLKSSGV